MMALAMYLVHQALDTDMTSASSVVVLPILLHILLLLLLLPFLLRHEDDAFMEHLFQSIT